MASNQPNPMPVKRVVLNRPIPGQPYAIQDQSGNLSLVGKYPYIEAIYGERANADPFQTNPNFGPPPGWDYKTAQRDWEGNPLPAGAVGWTPQGEAYYGKGDTPVIGDLLEWWAGAKNRILAPSEGEKAPEPQAAGGPSSKLATPVPKAEEGKKPGVIQTATRAVGEGIRGLGELANTFANAGEYVMGTGEALRQAGAGSSMADITQAVRDVMPEVQGEGFFADLARGFRNFVIEANPLLMTYNAARFLNSREALVDKTKKLEAALQSATIAYSAWVDPAIRQNFIQRYNAGEDPYLLAAELQKPGAELIGQLIFDPLNLVGSVFAKAPRAAGVAEDGAKLADAARATVLSGAAEAAQKEGKLQALTGWVQDAVKSRQAVRTGLERRGLIAAKASRPVEGFFALTAGGKRIAVNQVADRAIRTIFAAHPDPDDAADMLHAVVQMTSDNADEAAVGIDALLHSSMGNMAFDDDMIDLGINLRRMLTTDGVVDTEKFLDEVSQITDYNKAIEFAEKKFASAADDMFPTIAESVKRGDQVSPTLRALSRVDEALKKPANRINQFFADIYMGLNPGYAIRNMVQNYVHAIVDQGVGVLKHTPDGWKNIAQEWLGRTPAKMTQGIGPAGAVQGVKRRLFAQEWAQKFERQASEAIYGISVKRTMERMLGSRGGLPDIKVLTDAGLDPRIAGTIQHAIFQNKGNVSEAMKFLRGQMATGQVDAFRALEWASPALVKKLRAYPLGEESLFDAIAKGLAEATSSEEATKFLRGILAEIRKEAGKVVGEGVPMPIDIAGKFEGALIQTISEMKGVIPENAAVWLESVKNADHNAVIQYIEQVRSLKDPRAAELAKQMLDAWNTSVARSADMIQSAADEWTLLKKAGTLEGKMVSGTPEAKAIWDTVNKDILALWGKTRDDIVNAAEGVIADVASVTGNGEGANKLLETARMEYRRALKWDNATFDEAQGWFVSGGKAQDAVGTADRAIVSMSPDDFAANPPDGFKLETLQGEDIARANPDGSISLDPDKFFGHGPVERADILAHERAHFLEGLIPPEVKAKFFDDGVVSAYRGRNINEKLANMIQDGRLPDELKQYLPVPEAAGASEVLAPPYVRGTAPTKPRFYKETYAAAEEMLKRVEEGIGQHWGEKIDVALDPKLEAALKRYAAEATRKVNEARSVAVKVADADRDFALLDYGKKKGLDIALGYIFPYQFWYSRTYANWIQRFIHNPVILADYAKYRKALEMAHAGAPEWWKYQVNTNELLGLDSENPLYFNLEALLNPLNGLTGVDFNDPDKRRDWWTSTIDAIGKFGPSVWTPISLATAMSLYARGDKEAAARWAGRLFPQTATIKSALAALRGKVSDLPLQGEFDPMVQFFSGNLDPYEKKRVGRALAQLVEEGLITDAEAVDAANSQSGDIWNMAIDRAVRGRAAGQLLSFVGGVGMKARTQSDMEVDKFWGDYNRLWNMEPDMSPEEFREAMDSMRVDYPFMDAVILARKGGLERDRSFAYTVLGRIPPGTSKDFAEWANIPPELVSKFYDSKGHMEDWSESDQKRFMAGMLDLAAVLDAPDGATRQAYTQAKNGYKAIETQMKRLFGQDILDEISIYYGMKGDTPQEQAMANAYIEANPRIGDALDYKAAAVMSNPNVASYYSSISKIQQYFEGQMYDAIERELGSDIWDKWDEYWAIRDAGENAQAYYRQHPELKRYGEIKDEWEPIVAQGILQFGERLRDVPVSIRDTAGGSYGQEQIIAGIEGMNAGLPQLSWAEWQSLLGAPASRLVEDSVYEGGDIPESMLAVFRKIGEELGVDNPYVILQLAQGSVGR